LPIYAEIEAREFSSLSVMSENFDFDGKLRLKLPKYPSAIKKDLQEKLEITLSHKTILLTLKGGGAKCEETDSGVLLLIYELNQKIPWTPDLTFLPFDTQCVPVCIEIARLKIGKKRYYFNIINKDEKDRKEYFVPGQIRVNGLEDFLLYYCQARYEPVKTKIGRKRIEYSPQVTLNFALTRSPWNYFLTVLVPNFILQLLSLILFFTEDDFEERVKNITILILAIVAFLPTVRAGLPHIPYITLMDLIIYSSVANVGLCVLATIIDKDDNDKDGKDDPESDQHSVWFILACTLVFLTSMLIGICIFYRILQYFWMSKKTRDRIKATEKRIKEEIIWKSSLESFQSISYDELERARRGMQGGAATAIDTVSAESRQSQEVGQNGVVGEPSKGESLTWMEKRYVAREVEIREGTKDQLKTINGTP